MAHVRKQVRDWLKAHLVGSAEAEDRVEVRRALPTEKNLRPTLLIAVQNEQSQDDGQGGSQQRAIAVRITAVAKGDAEATEDTLDALGVFVERQIAADPTLGGIAATFEYQSTEFAFASEAERTLCAAALTFVILVYTDRIDPEHAA